METGGSFAADSVQQSGGDSLLLVVIVLVLVAAVFVGAYYLIMKLARNNRYRSLQHKAACKVMLPKQADEDDTKKDAKDLTAVMEPVFASVQNFHQEKWWKRFWYGTPTVSFELVFKADEVFFYVVAPADYLPTLQRQIHAQYPDAHIETAFDHDLFLDESLGEPAVAALKLAKSHIFPVKTFKTMEFDPLNALTNSLSQHHGAAAIQILVQPMEQKWQRGIEAALQNVQQGKDFTSQGGVLGKVAKTAGEIGKTIVNRENDGPEYNQAGNYSKQNVRLTALQEQQAKLMVEKGSGLGFRTQIRLVARAADEATAKLQIQTMLSAFSQYSAPEANSFRPAAKDKKKLLVDYVLRMHSDDQPTMILNTEELTSLFHFPNRHLDTPNVHWLGSRKLAPPVNLPKQGTVLGYSEYRGQEIPVMIDGKDRMRHVYAIGQTGVGKTNLYQNMIIQDIRAGHGVCYMDPNGDAVEWILRHIPKERAEDVIYFNPADTARPLALNLLEYDPAYPEQKTMVINEIISIFDKLYDLKATGGPIFEQYMRNAALLVMEDPDSGSTLMEIPKVLADEKFRKMKLAKCKNVTVSDFWIKEAEKVGGEAALANIVPYITSKLTQFTSSDIMRPIVGQQKSAFNFRELMDQRKILLVSLPKGLLGDMSASLLGMIISGKIQIAAFSRQNQPEADRTPFYLYVDEFQNFTSKTFATILSEARKYALSLNITHQYIEQLDEDTRNAVFGNVGTIINWRIGAPDAEFMVKIMDPLQMEDLINVEKFNYYIRLMVDSAPGKPFNVSTYPPDPHENTQVGEAIRQLSRLKFGREREIVEAEIRMRTQNVV